MGILWRKKMSEMKSVYVVVSQRVSFLAITHPWPVAAFATRKEAKAFADQKNAKATTNSYGVLRVPFVEKEND
jgi:hypothetical protein